MRRVLLYVLIALAALLLVDHFLGGKRAYSLTVKKLVDAEVETLTKGYQGEIDRLNGLLREKDTALRSSEQRYANLKALIKAKAAEAEAIKPSGDSNEIKARFYKRGFPSAD